MLHKTVIAVLLLVFVQPVVAAVSCPRNHCVYVPYIIKGESLSVPTVTATATATRTPTTTATATATATTPPLPVPTLTPTSMPTATVTTTPPTATATTPPTGTNPAWTPVTTRPKSNSEPQGVVVNGKLYVFGGFDPDKSCCTPTKRAYVYDPALDSWSPIADMPAMGNGTLSGGLTHAGTATDGSAIYFAGGYTAANATGTGQIFGSKEVWKYTVASNSYTRLPDLPVARAAGQLAVVGRNLHYIGGTNQARTQDVGDHYVLALDGGTSWDTLTPLPNPRHHAGAAVLNGKIYYIGGQRGHDGPLVPQSDVHVYDPLSNSWSQAASLNKPTNHAGSSTFVKDGRIIVVGGQMNHNQSIRDVVSYNPATNSWSALTPLPRSVHSGIGGTIGGKLYYSTGNTSSTLPHAMWQGVFGSSSLDSSTPGAAPAPASWLDTLITAFTPSGS